VAAVPNAEIVLAEPPDVTAKNVVAIMSEVMDRMVVTLNAGAPMFRARAPMFRARAPMFRARAPMFRASAMPLVRRAGLGSKWQYQSGDQDGQYAILHDACILLVLPPARSSSPGLGAPHAVNG
jgi:hypothetical protein